jgi:hypothetical protein
MTNFIKELKSKLNEKGFSKNYSITKNKIARKNTFDNSFGLKCDCVISGDTDYNTKNILEIFMKYKGCEKYVNLTSNHSFIIYRYSDDEANYLFKQKDNGLQSIYVYLK